MSQEAIDLLRSIDASLKKLVALSERRQRAAAGPRVAADRDLNGQYGNPKVSFNPRDWTGASCKGRRMSECPAEFLDMLAETFDYFAGQAEEKDERTNNGKPVAEYKRTDAARARGWAKRVREGHSSVQQQPAQMNGHAGGDWSSDGDWDSGSQEFGQ